MGPAASERCFANVSCECSLVLESQAKGESGQKILSEQIPVLDFFYKISHLIRNQLKFCVLLVCESDKGRETVAKNFREA